MISVSHFWFLSRERQAVSTNQSDETQSLCILQTLINWMGVLVGNGCATLLASNEIPDQEVVSCHISAQPNGRTITLTRTQGISVSHVEIPLLPPTAETLKIQPWRTPRGQSWHTRHGVLWR